MSIQLVARRYATALLDLGVEQGDLDQLVDDMSKMAEAYEENPDLRNALENPLVAHAAKKATLAEVGERLGLAPSAKTTLLLLIDRRRMKALPYIAAQLRELSDARKGIVRAEVTTAVKLRDDYYSRLQAQLQMMTGKKVVIDRREDPTLIGGVVTRIGDRIFDGSLRTRLQTMKDALLPQS